MSIVAREYIRYKLINNVYDKDKAKIAVLISIVYVLIDIEFNRFIGTKIAPVTITKYACQNVLP